MSAFLFVLWVTGLYALVFNLETANTVLRRLIRRLAAGAHVVRGRSVVAAARVRK